MFHAAQIYPIFYAHIEEQLDLLASLKGPSIGSNSTKVEHVRFLRVGRRCYEKFPQPSNEWEALLVFHSILSLFADAGRLTRLDMSYASDLPYVGSKAMIVLNQLCSIPNLQILCLSGLSFASFADFSLFLPTSGLRLKLLSVKEVYWGEEIDDYAAKLTVQRITVNKLAIDLLNRPQIYQLLCITALSSIQHLFLGSGVFRVFGLQSYRDPRTSNAQNNICDTIFTTSMNR